MPLLKLARVGSVTIQTALTKKQRPNWNHHALDFIPTALCHAQNCEFALPYGIYFFDSLK